MSQRERDDARLPEAAEALLKSWPLLDRAESAWQTMAESIETKIRNAEPEPTAQSLLEPPLPKQPGEGSFPIEIPAAEEEESFAEMARAVVKSRSKDAERDLAKQSLTVAANGRARVAELSEKLKASEQTPVPDSPRAAADAPGRSGMRRIRGGLIGGTIAVVALAAALLMKLGRDDQPPRESEVTPVAAQSPAPAADAPETIRQEPTPENQPAQPALTAEELPLAPERTSPAPAQRVTRAPAQPKAGQAPAQDPAKEKPTTDLPHNPNMKPATAVDSSGLPDTPAPGAVNVARSQYLGEARRCVVGHEQPSNAIIVFSSDGRVQSVSVTGPAAGTPAEACIKSALGKTRVEPFAKPTFSIPVPIRPL